MKDNLGIGVMIGIGMLGGNDETAKAVHKSIGKTIQKVGLVESETLRIEFTDGTRLNLWDDGQSCCEIRHMEMDRDLSYFVGATLIDIGIKDAPSIEDNYDIHEIQFLEVHTSKGVFQAANHNEHNGYYGGFSIRASVEVVTP